MVPLHTRECFNNHLGLWMVEPSFFRGAVETVRSNHWPLRQNMDAVGSEAPNSFATVTYRVIDSVAAIQMSGVMMKGVSKFADTVSTLEVRRALRLANRDPLVRAILLVIDSPGGSVAGTDQLAADVATSSKPVYAHIDDMGASAAYWVTSQAKRVTANRTGLIGSIGVVMVVEDLSKAAEMQGITVHAIATGPYKAAGAPGTPITSEMLSYWQKLVDETHSVFLRSVENGRGLTPSKLKPAADGRVFHAPEAKALGLIDAISSAEEALQFVSLKTSGFERKAAAINRIAAI